MNRQDRLEELNKLGNIHGHTTSSESVFSKWQGRVSALLSHDPIAQRKFENYSDFILDDHDFGSGLISHETVEATKKVHALIERVIADLEINQQYSPLSVPENLALPDPVVIPDASAFEPPETKFSAPSHEVTEAPKPCELTKDEGLLWFWHHCHYAVKWKLFGSVLSLCAALFALGWVANEQETLRDIGDALHKLFNPGDDTPSDDENADS